MSCRLYLEKILNFQCEHFFSKLKAPQPKNNSKQSAAIFVLIQLVMFHQQSPMIVLAIPKKNVLVRFIFQVQNLNSKLEVNPNECAILYDGINQSGAVENIPVGEFEHARDTNANGDPRMILGDRSESVYVYPVRAQLFAFWAALTVYFKSSPSI